MNSHVALADHLARRRGAILQAWREAVKLDAELTSCSSMPRAALNDHIPSMLSALERMLRARAAHAVAPSETTIAHKPKGATAHGLHRWQQGYDLREVVRELGRLNECVVLELDQYDKENPDFDRDALLYARWVWASAFTEAISASASQYYSLQQLESAGHATRLEKALEQLGEMDRQRAELWQQAAHDLRGNLGVVATATAGLSSNGAPAASQEAFLRLIQRNVNSLADLLDDVTGLARLQAGRERRQASQVDIAEVLRELCSGLIELAQEKNLSLKCEGPTPMMVEADVVKIRRIAQNLLLNAIKFTSTGGISVRWGDSDADDKERWALTISDTGPGFPVGPEATVAGALEVATHADLSDVRKLEASITPSAPTGTLRQIQAVSRRPVQGTGEGIGLSIVKRLCELLDATVEVTSSAGCGTTFRILLPRLYP